MTTIRKVFPKIPFAHRQHTHGGHCQFVHGHDWTFIFEFEGEPDAKTGFILDFGGNFMKSVREDLDELFDHALVLNQDDALGIQMTENKAYARMFKVLTIPSCSSEGIAAFLWSRYYEKVLKATNKKTRLHRIEVIEGDKNSAVLSVLG